MKRAFAIALGFVVAIGGCRTLLGIDDLQPAPPDDDGQGDGGGQHPGSGTKGADAALAISCAPLGQGCRKCCKADPVLKDAFEGSGRGAQCICDRGNCARDCSPNGGRCTPGPQPSATSEPDRCVVCMDTALKAGVCEDACNGDPGCLAALKCMEDCPQP